jgi:hypothetical protein
MHQGRAQTIAETSALGLGIFSIAIGVAGLMAPRLLGQAAGGRGSSNMIRLCAAREIVTGVGILLAWKRAPWVWARVAGDAVDIAMARRPAAIAALAGVTAVDVATAVQLSREENRPPARVYDYSGRSGFPKAATEMRGAARRPSLSA